MPCRGTSWGEDGFFRILRGSDEVLLALTRLHHSCLTPTCSATLSPSPWHSHPFCSMFACAIHHHKPPNACVSHVASCFAFLGLAGTFSSTTCSTGGTGSRLTRGCSESPSSTKLSWLCCCCCGFKKTSMVCQCLNAHNWHLALLESPPCSRIQLYWRCSFLGAGLTLFGFIDDMPSHSRHIHIIIC